MEGFGSGSQLGRPGQPSEIATTFVFLATAEAALYCKYSLFLGAVSEGKQREEPVLRKVRIDGQVLHPYPLGD